MSQSFKEKSAKISYFIEYQTQRHFWFYFENDVSSLKSHLLELSFGE